MPQTSIVELVLFLFFFMTGIYFTREKLIEKEWGYFTRVVTSLSSGGITSYLLMVPFTYFFSSGNENGNEKIKYYLGSWPLVFLCAVAIGICFYLEHKKKNLQPVAGGDAAR